MIGFDGVVASLIKNNRRLWHVCATGITDMRWCWNIPNRDKDNFINSSPPAQNGNHFADDVLTCIFLNENVWISIKTSMKFVPKGLINNIPALVQIMAWHRPGDKPLSEPMLTNFTDASMQAPGGHVNVTCLKLPETRLFFIGLFRLITKRTSKLRIIAPLWGKSTDNRWGHQCGKRSYVLTSSCNI